MSEILIWAGVVVLIVPASLLGHWLGWAGARLFWRKVLGEPPQEADGWPLVRLIKGGSR